MTARPTVASRTATRARGTDQPDFIPNPRGDHRYPRSPLHSLAIRRAETIQAHTPALTSLRSMLAAKYPAPPASSAFSCRLRTRCGQEEGQEGRSYLTIFIYIDLLLHCLERRRQGRWSQIVVLHVRRSWHHRHATVATLFEKGHVLKGATVTRQNFRTGESRQTKTVLRKRKWNLDQQGVRARGPSCQHRSPGFQHPAMIISTHTY